MNILTLKQRIYGAIFGLAIGDALGAPVETASTDYINQNFGVLNNYLDARYWKGKMSSDWIKGKWTDDTAFTLEIIKSINMHKDIYPEDIGQRFLELCESGDFDDMLGGTTKRAMEALKNNVDWKKTGTIAMKSKYQGAGGLMRTLPIGIYYYKDPQNNLLHSKNICQLTHASPFSIESCIIYNSIVSEILAKGVSKEDLKIFLEDFTNSTNISIEVRNAMQNALKLPKKDDNLYQNKKPNVLTIFETALWAFFHERSFEETLIKVINLGGDTDTIAAITGGLAGIYYGVDSIPKQWCSGLYKKEEILRTTKDFYQLIEE